MRQFTNVDWTTDIAKADTKAEKETAAHKHAMILGSSHNHGADDDENGTCEHSSAATPKVVDGADKRNSADRACVC